MHRHPHARLEGSLWGKGKGGILTGALVIVILLIFVPAIRWFLLISVPIGIAMFLVIHWYNSRVPVKDPNEAEIRLHLDDDQK